MSGIKDGARGRAHLWGRKPENVEHFVPRGPPPGSEIGAVFAYGDTLTGTDDADFILALTSMEMSGGAGGDMILGDLAGIRWGDFLNTSFATAGNLDTSVNLWSVAENPLFGNWLVPHLTAHIEAGVGVKHYYRINVDLIRTLTIDIDGGAGGPGNNLLVDTRIELYRSTDLVTPIATAAGSDPAIGGYGSVARGDGTSGDALLTQTVNAGTYYIVLSRADGDGNFIGGEQFLMNVSLSGHAISNPAAQQPDLVSGGEGADLLLGAGGADTIDGGEEADTIDGGSSGDLLTGGEGDDLVRGGTGDDTVTGGPGADIFEGGADSDRLDYRASLAAVHVDLGTNLGLGGDAEGDTVSGFEHVDGSEGGDTLTGDGGANALAGFGGDDLLIGGAGGDTLDGGEGVDRADYAASAAPVEIDLAAGTGLGGDAEGDLLISIEILGGSAHADRLAGSAGSERIAGRGGDDSLSGREGDDWLTGGDGGDLFDGGEGIDWADYSQGKRAGADLLNPTANAAAAIGDSYAGIENLLGSRFPDILRGDNGANLLDGGHKNDVLRGRAGNDTLVGGIGFDRLEGQGGVDHFVLSTTAADADIVEDFAGGTDKLALSGALFGIAPGALDPESFIAANSAQDAEDRLIYRAATGKLYYDADGTGAVAQVLIATFENLPTMGASDFIVT